MVLQCILFHDQLVLELVFILTSHAQYLHTESNSVHDLKHPVLDATVLTDQIHLSPRASSVVVHSLYVGNKVELS